MSSKIGKIKKVEPKPVKKRPIKRRFKTEKVIVDFDAEKLKAPFVLRLGAILIDYILLVSIPVISILISRSFGDDGSKLLNSEISNAGWLITILLGITNFIIFPMFSGQTIGKMFTGLRIVRNDGNPVTFVGILLRNVVGYFLSVLTFGLGFLLALFNIKGRALHDFLAGTIVVYGQKRVAKEVLE